MVETIKSRKEKAVKAKYVLDPEFPYEIFVDISSLCNHTCVFCSNSIIKRKNTMEPSIVRRVLKEAFDNGTRSVGLYGIGEPFLVKKLDEYVAYARGIGYEYIFLTTNGSLATPDRVKKVLDSGLNSIKFSISAGTRQSYKKIHGKDDFDTVLENLIWVYEYRKKSKLNYRIYVTMVYTDETKHEIELLKNLVCPYIDEWDPHLLTNQCGNKYDNNELGEIEKYNVRGRVKAETCFQPFKGFLVTPEGYVSACVLDYQSYLIVGDINKSSLKEIWNNKIYTAFRKAHIEGNINNIICYNCLNNTDNTVKPLTPEYATSFEK